MNPDQLQLLKDKLNSDFVPHLPELIPNQCSAEDNRRKNTSRALSAFAIKHLCHCSEQDAAKSVVDDYNDNGIDAIYFSPVSLTLYIVQSKLKASEDFKQNEAIDFCQGVRDLLNQSYDRFNSHVQIRQLELDNSLTEAHDIKILIAHSGTHISQHAKDKIDTFINEPDTDSRLSCEWIDYGPEAIHFDLTSEHANVSITATIELENARKGSGSKNTYYGEMHLSKLVELHTEHRQSLFHRNIRLFLGTKKSEINRGIQKTLRDSPENFFFYNNGITILARNIREAGTPRTRIRLELSSLSIINGAQTVASTAALLDKDPDVAISEAKVLVTIIESSNDDAFAEQITKNRNHQNAVHKSAFAALDSQQEHLRKECAMSGVTYQFRTEQEPNFRLEGFIGITEAAFALACRQTNPNTPYKLKRKSPLFLDRGSDEYRSIFNEDTSALMLINTSYLYRAAESILTAAELGESDQDKLSTRHGRFAIIWLVFQRHRNLFEQTSIIKYDRALELISPVLDNIRQEVIEHTRSQLDQISRGPLYFFSSEQLSRECANTLRSPAAESAAT